MTALRNFLVIVGAILLLPLAFCAGRRFPFDSTDINEKTDTLYIRDTITQIRPIYEVRKVTETVFLPADTVRMRDTLFVAVDREQLEWSDSLCTVYASGIRPRVDSVRHYVTDRIVTRTVEVPVRERTRWGIGISAGYGAGKGGLTPYIGIGISYNLLAF